MDQMGAGLGGDSDYSLYARIFLVVVVLVFLWMLFRKKKNYGFKGLKKYHTSDTVFRKYLDNYAREAVQNGKGSIKQQLDQATDAFGLPSVMGGIGGGISGSGMATPSGKSKNKTEEECRVILERIFNDRFISTRPDFLKNPKTGKNLEIDCYNERLGLALEYNGAQHYKYTPHFHRDKKDFYYQVHKDDYKRRKIKEHGIKIVEVPYWIRSADLEDYIRRQLRRSGFSV